MPMAGRSYQSSSSYRYGMNGKEKDDEIVGSGNNYDFGARHYDPRLGKWWGVDPKAHEYASWSPYVFCMNTPISAYDPDGKRTYFVGGAGLDTKGWNYTDRWATAFKNNGINDFKAFRNLSHDKAGSFPAGDISFTSLYRHSSKELVPTGTGFKGEPTGWTLRPVNNKMIEKAINQIIDDITKNPLKEGEQLNLTGYSYGSVLQAQVALKLADKGYKINNLILVGSPISTDSELYKELTNNKR